ncbi:MAG TPA: hypothetical protein VFQ35_21960 [Polyangiaceae bacterium]|nr:hypothetical protein [Polyangiaceae bacterium]
MKRFAFALLYVSLAACEHRRAAPAAANSSPHVAALSASAPASESSARPAPTVLSVDQHMTKIFAPAHQLQPYRGPRVKRIVDRCAVLEDESVRCFDGFEQLAARVEKVHLGSAGLFSEADEWKSGCAADTQGLVSCWGNVRAHTLGDKSRCHVVPLPPNPEGEDRKCPEIDGLYYCGIRARVCDEPTRLARLGPVTQLAGAEHNCALNAKGELWCWGDNARNEGPGRDRCRIPRGTNGQLGSEYCFDPVRVLGLPPLASFSLSAARTCAVTREGKLFCWGAFESVQYDAPTEQKDWPRLTEAVLTDGFLCGRTEAGEVHCQREGQQKPEVVPGLGRVTKLTGDALTCALNERGEVWCWMRSYPPFDKPHQVPAITSATQISARAGFACAILKDGAAYCWGSWTYRGAFESTPPLPLFDP